MAVAADDEDPLPAARDRRAADRGLLGDRSVAVAAPRSRHRDHGTVETLGRGDAGGVEGDRVGEHRALGDERGELEVLHGHRRRL